ncbi:Cullin binding-domain-containing protein [Tricharina praecox]|uniref:Cullin binding-domain-containing protein n=1 Tax=Tricharina praecox TaxID=43433 RepID=UPI00221F81C0|nr:Cullin binding-domain-containing protein [Tricharina praecox]KAI5843693.1 Cullin binding-domain-containing protein [Tricharina praecox]
MSYNSSQRTAIQQFIAFTQCSERTAAKFLKSSSWNVEAAADSYFQASNSSSSAGTTGGAASSKAELNKLFDQFREAGDAPDTFGVNGSIKFLEAIGVGLDEDTVLVISEFLKAPIMAEFSREGFVTGWQSLNCKTLDQMRARVPALRQLLGTDEEVFKRVYMHTFALARTQGQKSLLLETAIEYWKLLLNKRFEAQLPVWIEFLQKEYRKSVSKDTWNCMYDFIQLAQKDPGLKTYDVDGAWPSILDDFVRYWRKRHPQAEPTDGDAME